MMNHVWNRFVAWRQLLERYQDVTAQIDPFDDRAGYVMHQARQIKDEIELARRLLVWAIYDAEHLIPRHHFYVAVSGATFPESQVVMPDFVVVGRHFFEHPYTRLENDHSDEPLNINWFTTGPSIETVRIEEIDGTWHYYGPGLIAEVDLSAAACL